MDMNSFLLGTQYGNRGGGGGGNVPTPTSEDVGKVLSVGENLNPLWTEASSGADIAVLSLNIPDVRDIEDFAIDREPTHTWVDITKALDEHSVVYQSNLRGVEGLRVKRAIALWDITKMEVDSASFVNMIDYINSGKPAILTMNFLSDGPYETDLNPVQVMKTASGFCHRNIEDDMDQFHTDIINCSETMINGSIGGLTDSLFQAGFFDITVTETFCIIEYERTLDTSLGVKDVLTNEDNVLVINRRYLNTYENMTSADTLYLTLPVFSYGDLVAQLTGSKIEIEWKNGSTVPTIECSLDDFNYIPKANTTSRVTFTLDYVSDTSDYGYYEGVWHIDVEELNDPVNIKETETWTFTLEDGTTVTKKIISVTQSTTQGGGSNG